MTADPKPPPPKRPAPIRSLSPLGMPAVRALVSGATVLVVDGDGVSRRFVELALATKAHGGFLVETAKDASSALDILRNTLVDLIISEIDLPDMSGLRFHRRLSQESRLRSIPFLFLSADTRVATKLVALRSGVEDYLTKPCDIAELAARVESVVGRHRRLREAFRRRSYVLAGDFSAIAFPDLVGMLELGRRTGTLAVATDRGVGELFFSTGSLVHAVFGNLTGAEAFYALLGEETGKFEFSPDESSTETTIQDSLTQLIMEGAKILDDARRDGRDVVEASCQTERDPLPSARTREPAIVPSPHLAAHFNQGIADPFTLGELRLWTTEELTRWTAARAGRERLHVLLFAELGAGSASILSLSGAPTERWVVGALSDEPKALGVAFFLRYEHMIDLVLADIQKASAFLKSYGRVPSIVLVAPPQGDFLDIGTKARVELDNTISALAPTVLLGVGNPAVDNAISELSAVRKGVVPAKCVPGALGDGGTDLRALLIDAIRFWVSCAPPPPLTGLNTTGKIA